MRGGAVALGGGRDLVRILAQIFDQFGTLVALTVFGLTNSAFGTCAITMIGSNFAGSKPSLG